MKRIYLLFFLIVISIQVQAQCSGNRYKDYTFSAVDLTTDVVYGSNLSYGGDETELAMDIYQPAGDTETERPLIIVCHGGYFLGGDKAETDVAPLCNDLAKIGYVVASINYRLGIPIAVPLQEPYGQAVVRAVQDLRAAIRWFRKNAAEDGNTYNIDSNMIFVGGDSAGGFMALHHAYMDEDEIPAWLDMNGTGMEGGMDGESGSAGYSSEVTAIFSVSGAIGDVSWIDADDEIPACIFHGDEDGTVTINTDMFILFGLLEVTEISGGNPINARMDETGIQHCYVINEGGGHVPYLGNDDVYDNTLALISYFFSHFVCGTTFDCNYTALTNDLAELSKDNSVLYPNPCIAGCNVRSAEYIDRAEIEIHDAFGKLVNNQFISGYEISIPANLMSGVYFITITTGDHKVVSKITVAE